MSSFFYVEFQIDIAYKGCWRDDKSCSDSEDCISTQAVSTLTEKMPHIFCCCNHQRCNQNFYWHPAAEVPTTTPRWFWRLSHWSFAFMRLCSYFVLVASVIRYKSVKL